MQFDNKRFYSSLIRTMIISLLVALVLMSGFMMALEKNRRERAQFQASRQGNILQYSVNTMLLNLEALSTMVVNGGGKIENFDEVAKNLINGSATKNAIGSLQLAPNGVVTQIYPEQGNEQGKIDLFADPERRWEAEIARDTGKTTLAGPYELLQGGYAAVARMPVYLKDGNGDEEFWGFVIEVINVKEALEPAQLETFEEDGYRYCFWRENPTTGEKMIIRESSGKELKNPVSVEVPMPNVTWYFDVEPQNGWFSFRDILMCIGFVVAFVLFGIGTAYFNFSFQEKMALKKRRDFLRDSLDNIATGVAVCEIRERKLVPLIANRQFLELTGIGQEEFEAWDMEGFLRESGWSDLNEELLGTIEKTGIATDYEGTIMNAVRKEREWFLFNLRTSLSDGRRALFYITLTDIEKEKNVETELVAALEAAKVASKSKTDFLSRMSHDIRTPMNVIAGMSLIARENPDDKEKVADALEKIDATSRQLKSLINDVLDMSRLESGKVVFAEEPFNLRETLEDTALLVEELAETDKIQFRGIHYQVIHENVLGSQVQLQKLVTNIFSNAVKYNKPGGTVECWLEEETADEEHSVYRMKVQDSGIGIGKDFLERIFEPFTREHNDPNAEYKGTGLGMAISKEIVDRMGGSIEIDSEVGVGTTIDIAIPFRLDLETKATRTSVKEAVERDDLSGLRILLVDDYDLNVEIAKYMLEGGGAEVITANNGLSAVQIFEQAPVYSIDCILMDIMMPIMDGIDAARKIRLLDKEDAKTVPIIAVTANAFTEDVEAARDAGMNGHVSRPIDKTVLLNMIASHVREKNGGK